MRKSSCIKCLLFHQEASISKPRFVFQAKWGVFTLTPAGEFPGLAVVVLPKTVIPVREFPGLDVVVLPKLDFGFLSAGFNIWKEHISVSSTLIMAPALSNSPQ